MDGTRRERFAPANEAYRRGHRRSRVFPVVVWCLVVGTLAACTESAPGRAEQERFAGDARRAGRGAADRPSGGHAFRRRSELATTLTDEKAMAAAAHVGVIEIPKNGIRAPAATGIATTL